MARWRKGDRERQKQRVREIEQKVEEEVIEEDKSMHHFIRYDDISRENHESQVGFSNYELI